MALATAPTGLDKTPALEGGGLLDSAGGGVLFICGMVNSSGVPRLGKGIVEVCAAIVVRGVLFICGMVNSSGVRDCLFDIGLDHRIEQSIQDHGLFHLI